MTELEFENFQKQFNELKDEYSGFKDKIQYLVSKVKEEDAKAIRQNDGKVGEYTTSLAPANAQSDKQVVKEGVENLKKSFGDLKASIINGVKDKVAELRFEYTGYYGNKEVDGLIKELDGYGFVSKSAEKFENDSNAFDSYKDEEILKNCKEIVEGFENNLNNMKKCVEFGRELAKCLKERNEYTNYCNEVKIGEITSPTGFAAEGKYDIGASKAVVDALITKIQKLKPTDEKALETIKNFHTELTDKIKEFKKSVLNGFKTELETLKKDYEDSFKEVKVEELVKDLSDETKKLIDDQKKNIESVINTKIEKDEDIKNNKNLLGDLKANISNLKKSIIDAIKALVGADIKKDYDSYCKSVEMDKIKGSFVGLKDFYDICEDSFEHFKNMKNDSVTVKKCIDDFNSLKNSIEKLKAHVEFCKRNAEYLKLQTEYTDFCDKVKIGEIIRREHSKGGSDKIDDLKKKIDAGIANGLTKNVELSAADIENNFKNVSGKFDELKKAVQEFLDKEKKEKEELIKKINDEKSKLEALNKTFGDFKKLESVYRTTIISMAAEVCSKGQSNFGSRSSYIRDNFSGDIKKVFEDFGKFLNFKCDDSKSVNELEDYNTAISDVESCAYYVYYWGYNFIAHEKNGTEIEKLNFHNDIVNIGKGHFEKAYKDFEDIKNKANGGEIKVSSNDDTVNMFIKLYNISHKRKNANQKDLGVLDKKIDEVVKKYEDVSKKYTEYKKVLNGSAAKYRDIIIKYADKSLEKVGNNIFYKEYKDVSRIFGLCTNGISDIVKVETGDSALNSLDTLNNELDWIGKYGLQFLQDKLGMDNIYSNIVNWGKQFMSGLKSTFGVGSYNNDLKEFEKLLTDSKTNNADLKPESGNNEIVKMFIELYNLKESTKPAGAGSGDGTGNNNNKNAGSGSGDGTGNNNNKNAGSGSGNGAGNNNNQTTGSGSGNGAGNNNNQTTGSGNGTGDNNNQTTGSGNGTGDNNNKNTDLENFKNADYVRAEAKKLSKDFDESKNRIPNGYYDKIVKDYLKENEMLDNKEFESKMESCAKNLEKSTTEDDKTKFSKEALHYRSELNKSMNLLEGFVLRFIKDEIDANAPYNASYVCEVLNNRKVFYDNLYNEFKKVRDAAVKTGKSMSPNDSKDWIVNLFIRIYNASGKFANDLKNKPVEDSTKSTGSTESTKDSGSGSKPNEDATLKGKVDRALSNKKPADENSKPTEKMDDVTKFLDKFAESLEKAGEEDSSKEKGFYIYSKKKTIDCLKEHVLNGRSKSSFFSKSNAFAKKMIKLLNEASKISGKGKQIFTSSSNDEIKDTASKIAKSTRKKLRKFISIDAGKKNDPPKYLTKETTEIIKYLETYLKDCKKEAQNKKNKDALKAVGKWNSVLKSVKGFNKEVVKFNKNLTDLQNKYSSKSIDKGVPMFADADLNDILRGIMSETNYCLIWGIFGSMVCYFTKAINYGFKEDGNLKGVQELNEAIEEVMAEKNTSK